MIFDRINEWLDKSELSWVNLLTKALPIIVPIIPAIQTKNHVVSVLEYEAWTGWVAAIIVEFFGYAAMYKMMQFAEHNRRYAEKNKAPFGVAVVIYAAYLAIIITFNVIPEIAERKPAYIVVMNALFAILSVPAGALTAVSALHTERKEAMRRKPANTPNEHPAEQEANTERRTPRRTNSLPNIPVPANTNAERFTIPNGERTQRIEQTAEQLRRTLGRPASVREIQAALRVADGTESGWSTSTISNALYKDS